MVISAENIKQFARDLGAEACGIASVDRFDTAPDGFRPTDIYKKCKSVVVFLKSMPEEIIMADNPVPYTHAAFLLYAELDRLGLGLCRAMESVGVHAVPVPTDTPYLFWDSERQHGMGILSMRHAAVAAGLGVLGKNTLLLHKELGNMVYIGAILIDTEITPDPLLTDTPCPPKCDICLQACPVQALDGTTVNQALCRQISFFKNERGFDIYNCNQCRQKCPRRLGYK